MKSIPGILILLCALLCSTQISIQAENLTSFSFYAEVTQVSGIAPLNGQVAIGDVLSGSMTVDLDITPELSTSTANFWLNDGLSGITMSLNGMQFNSVKTNDPGLRDNGFYADFFSNRIQGQVINCFDQLHYISRQCDFPNSPPPAECGIVFRLHNNDCDNIIDNQALPTAPNLDNWTRGTLEISHANNYTILLDLLNIFSGSLSGIPTSGQVFGDIDADCTLDNDETNLHRRTIKFEPGPFYASSNRAGVYSLRMPPGSYTATVNQHPLWIQSCPAAPATLVIDPADVSASMDFALQPVSALEAVDISVVSEVSRPGFRFKYHFRVRNVGTVAYSGAITLTHDDILLDFESWPMADGYSAPTATWNITNLQVDQSLKIEAEFRVPPNENLLGDFICVTVDSDLNDKNDDELLRQSRDEFCHEIRGSYDPNDIQVFSGTRNADGPILQDQVILNYLIRFQNEGNEDAINVRVVDALSEFHRIDKLRLGAASHDYEFNFTDEGELQWTFTDINLPPKERDEPGSNGFIKFEVFLKDGLDFGTEIPNSAAIYFDFNSPVITNTVVSRIAQTITSVGEQPQELELEVFPNPSSDKLTVQFAETQQAELTINNLLGENLLTTSFNGTRTILDLQTLAAGSYYLRVQTAQGVSVRSIQIMR